MSLNSDKTDFGPAQRAKALADLMVLDTPEEQAFDDLVFVAAKACDVPIALITQQYLQYLDLMKELDLDSAGEFLVMAATLVEIKSRMS